MPQTADSPYWSAVGSALVFALLLSIPAGFFWLLYHAALAVIEFTAVTGP